MSEPKRKRETPRARAEREAYEAHMQTRAAEERRRVDERADRAAFGGRPAGLARPARKQAHAEGVETELEAAAANAAGKATNARRCLEQHARAAAWNPPGLTDDEVGAILGLPDIEANRRCSGLRDDRLLEWLLEQRHGAQRPVTRRTRKGRPARVSVITELGRRVLG